MRRCALVLATALLSVTALAGCGSADDEAADDTETTTSSSTEDESPDTEDSTDDTGDAPDDKSGSDSTKKSGGSDDSGEADDTKDKKEKPDDDSGTTKQAKADYCSMLKSLRTDFNPSNSASLAASRDIDAVADRLGDITSEAPAKVRPSWQRLTGTLESFAGMLEKYDIELSDENAFNKLKPKERTALSKAAQKYQSPQIAKATATIEKDAKRRCNVTLG